jgi:HEAT repeat protein
MTALEDREAKVRASAASALSAIGPGATAAVPALSAALRDNDRSVREHAAAALGGIGPTAKEAVSMLIAILKDESVGKTAATALGQIGPGAKEALPSLNTVVLQQYAKPIWFAAALALQRIDPESKLAVPALISAVKDKNRQVRMEAVATLGEMGPAAKGAISALEEAVRIAGADQGARNAAESALKKIRGEP